MAYKEVEWLFQREVEETYNLTVGGKVITTTDEHPFWIVGKGWVKSKDLLVDDVLTTSAGKEIAIDKIEMKKEHVRVYNFKVKDFHTYFVSNLGIWTHNACWGKVSYDDLKSLSKADQYDIRRIYGDANDAFDFFKEQVEDFEEVKPGIFVGKDANVIKFSYRADSKSGPPTIDINGVSGVRKIKFLLGK